MQARKFEVRGKRSTGKFAGKVPGKFTGDNPAIDLNPALDSVGPNSPTLRTRTVRSVTSRHWLCSGDTHGRPCVSVSTHRTSVAVRQHTHRNVPWPSVSTQLTSGGCPSYTVSHAPWTLVWVGTTRGRPSAHAGAVAVRVCRVSGSGTQNVRQHTQDAVQHMAGLPVAVRVCPCVRQCTQDVRQHTQDIRQHTHDIRQHTQDVRGCPCVSVCPSVHTGHPSAHAGHPSAHAGRPSAHAGRPWLSVCVRVSVSTRRTSVSTHRTSVSTQRTSVAHCFRTNTVSGLAKAGWLVAFSLTLFVPGFGDIRKLCVRSNQN
ncbi:hypothetical protein IGI04_000485 [Brassica rapa subsp. trilocularis]|uniref:Uncharacterized protein n=1 Tax=Brassica rapa subsp. trilocularis TaxID=1813537 RepID=A0ABQ7NQ76_BRACM|nr:hypothetical protein IGI04_000485 [Brassica rapa subsp. trilocularis]